MEEKNRAKFSLSHHPALQLSWNNATDREWEIIQRFFVAAFMNAYHEQPMEELALGSKISIAMEIWQSIYGEAFRLKKFEILNSKIIKPIKFYFSHVRDFLAKESLELKANIHKGKDLGENIVPYMIKLIALRIYFESCFHEEKNNIAKLAIERIHYLVAYWHEHPVGFISCELNPKSARTYLRWVSIAPGFHHLGIGKKMLAEVSKHFSNGNSMGIEVYTRRANETAQLFYRRCGFVENEEFDFIEPDSKFPKTIAESMREWLTGKKLYLPSDDATDEPDAHIGFSNNITGCRLT